MRSPFLAPTVAICALVLGTGFLSASCSKAAPAAPAGDDPCLYSACDPVDASRPVKADAAAADASPRDAAWGDSSPGNGVTEWDGFVPPVDGDIQVPIRDATWGQDGVSGPGGPIAAGPMSDATDCGPGPVAFATNDLEVITTGANALPVAFKTQWAAAVARAGSPGPGLVVLANTGSVDGGTRRFYFGAPVAAGSAYAFVSQPNNPFIASWNFVPASYVEATAAVTVNTSAAVLRFRTAAGSNVDVPVVDASFQGAIRGRAGDAALCTGLGNTVLSLVIPAAGGSITLEGQTLEGTLGAPARQASGVIGWTIRLFGSLPKVAFSGALP